VSGAVSGKTSYLVVGSALEDGREVTQGTKYKAALEKKVRGYRCIFIWMYGWVYV
jgi:replication factor C subunit 1